MSSSFPRGCCNLQAQVDRQLFRQRLLDGAESARQFAEGFVEESLPEALSFHLHLNQSDDRDAGSEFRLFPEDSSPERAFREKHLTADAVLTVLWRNSAVPQWINLSVVGETGEATLVEVLASGRFTSDETKLYHQQEGRAPFHVLGPALPIDHVQGRRFSIHARSSCWSRADFDRLLPKPGRVWSLELNGPAFSDELVLPDTGFPALELLDLRSTELTARGVGRLLALAPRLRVLRWTCGNLERLDLSGLPPCPALDLLALSRLPAFVEGVARIATAFPALTELVLEADGVVVGDAPIRIAGLERLSLRLREVPPWIGTASGLTTLSVRCPRSSNVSVERLLREARETLTVVHLRGTPVTAALFPTLASLPKLEYVGLVDTNVGARELAFFAQERPALRYHPRLGPRPPRKYGWLIAALVVAAVSLAVLALWR